MTTTISRPTDDEIATDAARMVGIDTSGIEGTLRASGPTDAEDASARRIKQAIIDNTDPPFEPSTFKLQDKVVLLIMTMRAPGNERRIKGKEILTTDADKTRLAVSKTLIDAKEFKAISKHDSRIRDYIQSSALPSPFKAGVYAVPLTMLSQVDERLTELAAERRTLVDSYALVYDAAVEKSRKILGSEFRQSDYLTPSSLVKAYSLEWQFVSLTAPDQIATLDQRVFKREQARLAKQWEEAVTEVRDALRIGLADLVEDMVSRLDKVEDGGDAKRFKPTKLLERFETFLSNVQARNVTNDTEIAALAEQAREILRGVTTEELKKKSDVRGAVKAGLSQVKGQLDKMDIVPKGRRKITLDDE